MAAVAGGEYHRWGPADTCTPAVFMNAETNNNRHTHDRNTHTHDRHIHTQDRNTHTHDRHIHTQDRNMHTHGKDIHKHAEKHTRALNHLSGCCSGREDVVDGHFVDAPYLLHISGRPQT